MSIMQNTRNAEHDAIEQQSSNWGGQITVLPPKKKPKVRSTYTATLSPAQQSYQDELKRLK
jgi:hypothetical protein